MKKITTLVTLALIALNFQGKSQLIQASIGAGAQANQVIIYLKADQTQATPSLATLQFNIGVDTTGITTPPTVTIPTNAFGCTWLINPAYKEGAFWNYNIYTAASPLTVAGGITANTEFAAMTVQFDNGAPSPGNVALVSLPDGGTGGTGAAFGFFYCTGSYSSNGLGSLYYPRTGVTVTNGNSYDPQGVQTGTATSIAWIPNIALPVRFVNFSVAKNGDNANLTWSIENESAITDHYEVERSLNGVDFTKAYTVQPKNNGLTSNTYNLSDLKLSLIKASGVIYYRIKQIDRDGNSVSTEIRSVRMSKGFSATINPNPVTSTVATLSLDLVNEADVAIRVTDASGKDVLHTQLHGTVGLNVKKLDLTGLASGNYMIYVQAGDDVKTLPVIKTN